MIEVKREDFFVESIKNPIEYGTYYKINQKYGIGFQWTSEGHHDFVITVTDIRFNQETMVGEHIGPGYVLALYISGAGDEFYPYQNVSPNTLRCYEPSEKYKAIYHPQIPLRCITVQFDQEFIDQYLQEISGDLEVNFSDFFKEKGYFVGIYASESWFGTYIEETGYPKWIAAWISNDGNLNADRSELCDLYQYTSKPIDKDVLYVEFDKFKSDPIDEELPEDKPDIPTFPDLDTDAMNEYFKVWAEIGNRIIGTK